MKPSIKKQIKALNIVIYAQNGILAGDLAALLSGHNTVDRQTSLPGILTSLNSQTDLLLLAGSGAQNPAPDPMPVLQAAKDIDCKVIMLGSWPADLQGRLMDKGLGPIILLEEIPSPAALFEIIASTTKR